MTAFLTITGDRRELSLLLLEDLRDSLHSVVISLRCSLEAELVPFILSCRGFDLVPDRLPIMHCNLEGLNERMDVGEW